MSRFLQRLLFLCVLFFFASLHPAIAAYKGYDAQLQSFAGPTGTVLPGSRIAVAVSFRNTGTQPWKRTGKTFLSVYHWDPVKKVETPSLFADTTWESSARPTRLPVASLAPNGVTTFRFFVTAPSTSGHYRENFILTAENTAWIKTGGFYVDFSVASTDSVATPPQTASMLPASNGASAPVPTQEIPIQAEIVDRGGSEWAVAAQDDLAIRVGIKNLDTRLWSTNQVYLAPVDDAGQLRTSLFAHPTWQNGKAGVIENGPIHGLETARLKLLLRAPNTPGIYRERFQLFSSGGTAVPGVSLVFLVRVAPAPSFEGTAIGPEDTTPPPTPPAPAPTTAAPVPIATNDGAYVTTLLLRSANTLELLGNGRQQLTFGFKNTGTQTWSQLQARLVSVTPEPSKRRWIQDDSWMSADQTAPITLKTAPGEIGFFSFYVKAPPKHGTYVFTFRLFANGKPVQNGDLQIPMTVATDGYLEADPVPLPSSPTRVPSVSPSAAALPIIEAQPLNGDPSTLSPEPLIRVGLFKTTDDQMQVRAKYAPLTVLQGSTSICHVSVGQLITIRFARDQNTYHLSGDTCNGDSATPYLVRADDSLSAMEIADFSRPVSWLPGANDNTFRVQLELRFTPVTNEVWIINELPIEWYLKGIAETSNVSPPEFQRTLLTAARTYAMYHVLRATKHAATSFTVDATYDQVYRGYGAEQRDPNVVAAIDATRGQIVTYNGKLALTPYYSRSDGRTRSWGEVWYGGSQYPWLVSVPVPWDQGRTLWGHGVGLSASGALGMANDGKHYDEILRYFYTGTELRRAYR